MSEATLRAIEAKGADQAWGILSEVIMHWSIEPSCDEEVCRYLIGAWHIVDFTAGQTKVATPPCSGMVAEWLRTLRQEKPGDFQLRNHFAPIGRSLAALLLEHQKHLDRERRKQGVAA